MADSQTTDIVRITAAAYLSNPNKERPDLNKLSAAVMHGLDIGMEEGTLTPDDATYEVKEVRLSSVNIQTGLEVASLLRDANLEEQWPKESITDPRKFMELSVLAMFDDIDHSFTLMPSDAVNSLHDHLTRFCQAHGIQTPRLRELHDYALTVRTAPQE